MTLKLTIRWVIIKDGEVQDYIPRWFHRRVYTHISYRKTCALKGQLSVLPLNKRSVFTLSMPNVRCPECGTEIFIDLIPKTSGIWHTDEMTAKRKW